eukprot:Nitzschia sp. Nitz4//scaffold174_size87051//7998//9916//NITZ4_005099-RA/size87051-processed-gene-0.53-mRNA-1//1//CDS//3329538842//1062//frame0
MASNENPILVDDEDDEPMDDEQLEEYRKMVMNLGTFPDKVMINSLTMVAEDYEDSPKNASLIYKVIREPLLSKNVIGDRKLPLVYLVDSILKNVKGVYIPIIEQDTGTWLPVVYDALSEEKRAKLKKVYNIWRETGIFPESSWKAMGTCFTTNVGGGDGAGGAASNAKLDAACITWGKDGGLLLMPQLRSAMQTILDELQSDIENELEKVSLERLASIDPDLLIKIKRTAEDSLRHGGAGASSQMDTEEPKNEASALSFLVDTRSQETLERSKAWAAVKLDALKEADEAIAGLKKVVADAATSDSTYTQNEAIDMTNALGAAGAVATMLSAALAKLKVDDKKAKSAISSSSGNSSGTRARSFFTIDKKLFTNEGIKKVNMAVVGLLYEVGLPFVSSADGRRFSTQQELSQHLDALFKRGQLEKTMAKTEERGWYMSDPVWCGEAQVDVEEEKTAEEAPESSRPSDVMDAEADPSTFTCPADETRDRCVICGVNFKMVFDNDDGIYKYNNCREIEVLLDEMALDEKVDVFVHVSCWRALGSPSELYDDQTLQEAMPKKG